MRGRYIRTRSLWQDKELPPGTPNRPIDYGLVVGEADGQLLVQWSTKCRGCLCRTVSEDPANVVEVPEAEYNAFVAGYNAGENAGYEAGYLGEHVEV